MRADLIDRLGAKLGAILCGLLRTAVDSCGIETPPFRPVWTAVDACGHRLEIYGSEGWGLSQATRASLPARADEPSARAGPVGWLGGSLSLGVIEAGPTLHRDESCHLDDKYYGDGNEHENTMREQSLLHAVVKESVDGDKTDEWVRGALEAFPARGTKLSQHRRAGDPYQDNKDDNLCCSEPIGEPDASPHEGERFEHDVVLPRPEEISVYPHRHRDV